MLEYGSYALGFSQGLADARLGKNRPLESYYAVDRSMPEFFAYMNGYNRAIAFAERATTCKLPF